MFASTTEVLSAAMLTAGVGGPLLLGAAWLYQRRHSAGQSSGQEGQR